LREYREGEGFCMKAAVLTAYREIEWMDVPNPQVKDSEILIRISYAGICGSDQHIFDGQFHPRTKLPLIMGHEFVGIVVDMGKNVSGFDVDERVVVDPIYWCGQCPACEIKHYPACTSLKLVGIDSNGGFGELVVVKDFMVYKIDQRISNRDAVLIEPLAIGFHAIKRSGVQPGDTLAIYSAGRIGQSVLQAARTVTDNTIFVIDVLNKRLELAKKAYPDVITIHAQKTNPVEVIKDYTKGKGVDIAFEAVGEAQHIEGRVHPIRECIRSIRGAGKVCVLSLTNEEVPLVMKDLIWKEGTIMTSRVTHGEYKDTIYHLANGDLHPEVLISSELPMSAAQTAFDLLEKDPENYLRIVLKVV
jgi:threonine dehydrogenase-like Zn-dependent dehydrogenase